MRSQFLKSVPGDIAGVDRERRSQNDFAIRDPVPTVCGNGCQLGGRSRAINQQHFSASVSGTTTDPFLSLLKTVITDGTGIPITYLNDLSTITTSSKVKNITTEFTQEGLWCDGIPTEELKTIWKIEGEPAEALGLWWW